MKRHEFELTAKRFRAGKISLSEFGDAMYGNPNDINSVDANDAIPPIPVRKPDSHKGSYGKILVVGGSPGMAGAPALSASAALRSGGGLVTLLTDPQCRDTVASFNPCVMTDLISRSTLKLDSFDAIAIGPGFGTEQKSISMTLAVFQYAKCPVVVDADALNCLALESFNLSDHAGPRILTPHPGEYQRLFPESSQNRQNMELDAMQNSQKHDITIVLKGANTFVTNGRKEYRNQTGNNGMATAGSGDVLTGVIAGLLGQGMLAYGAAQLGVYLHGLAGDLAVKKVGLHSMIATDLVNFLPDAFIKHAKA